MRSVEGMVDIHSYFHNRTEFMFSFYFPGYMNPPVLVDINKDGVSDVISAGFADSIQAFDGETFKQLWSFRMVGTETYS